MIRQIIHIDEEKCNGCGACAAACHEGAIEMVDGKARLMRDDYCDGLGDCLPSCPAGAIRFVNREAAAYDEAAVEEHKNRKMSEEACQTAGVKASEPVFHGCPGSKAKAIQRGNFLMEESKTGVSAAAHSRLNQWPVQIKLAPVKAAYFENADLLIAADCTAYAYGNFHEDFIRNRITLIGCPKLDEGDYSEKLTEIIAGNNIKSVTVVRMEVPCCGGIERAVKTALQNSGKFLPWQVVTLATDGSVLE